MSCPSHWDPYSVPASRQPWRHASGFRGPTSPGAPRNVETKKCLVLFEGRHGPTICSAFIVFSVKLNYEAGSILNQHCAEKHVSLRWPLHTIASTSNWMEMSQKMYTLCTTSTIERCRGLVYKRTLLFRPGQTNKNGPVV